MCQFQQLQAFLIFLACIIGCGEDSSVTKNAVSRGVVEPNLSIKTQRVISWAEKSGIVSSTGVLEVKIGRVDSFVGEEWIAEGRAIPEAEDILLRLLEKKDQRINPILIVQGLGVVGTSKCVPVLAELARGTELNYYAANALAELALPECTEHLERYLYIDGVDKSSRHVAIVGLTRIDNQDAADALKRSLLDLQEEEKKIQNALNQLNN